MTFAGYEESHEQAAKILCQNLFLLQNSCY